MQAAPQPPATTANNRTTVIGLGNEFLSDDGLGILAVRRIADRMKGTGIVFQELAVGGIGLLDCLDSYDRCIIVDAIATGASPAGTIHRFARNGVEDAVPITSSHQLDLGQVLTLGHLLGASIPESVTVYGIEAYDITTFRTEQTPEVAHALPGLVDAVCAELNGAASSPQSGSGQWQIITSDATH